MTTTYQSLQPRSIRRTVAPTYDALDMNLVRQHCRIDTHDEDQLLREYAEAAADYAEHYQNRALRTSTWEAIYDGFPGCEWELPRQPLQSVSSITYLDEDGASQTLSTDVYLVAAASGRVALKPSQVWPVTQDRIATVTVTYVAGYTSAALIPASTRQAMRILTGHLFENREPIIAGQSVANVPYSVRELLDRDAIVSYR